MRQINEKYQTSGDITKMDGTPVPSDEPLMLFRGKDKLLPQLLDTYIELCREAGSPEGHLNSLRQQADKIREWQTAHQETVKRPD